MTKNKMMETMYNRIVELETESENYEREIINQYIKITGNSADDKSTVDMVNEAVETLKSKGQIAKYKFDIEYMYEFKKENYRKSSELKAMFNVLFEIDYYE